MAIKPLFVASITALKDELRLSGVQKDTDAEEIINGAIEYARTQIYARLGVTATATMVATAYAQNPTTEAGIRRAAANRLEVLLVKAKLLCDLPTLFMDSSGGAEQTFNEEGLPREMDQEEIRLLLQKMSKQIEEMFELVSGDEELGEDAKGLVFTGENKLSPKPHPVDSTGRRYANFDGNFIPPKVEANPNA